MINQVIHGDCLKIMKDIPDNSIDLVVTSPPYDNLRDYKGYSFDFEKIAKELFRIVKEGGVVVWVVGDATIDGSETGTSFKQALYFKEIGFNLHDTMIYQKNSYPFPPSNRYFSVFEYMFIFSSINQPKTFNPIKDRNNKRFGDVKHGTIRQKNGETKRQSSLGKSIAKYGQRFNVWEMSTEQSNIKRKHPAQFPEQLAEDHIKSWSNEGDLVLDIFNGSGTTTKMAYLLKRNFIGIEISKEYCEIARQRLRQKTLL